MKVADRRLIWAFTGAAIWLAVLTSINLGMEQKLRSILLFALPVALVGWRGLVAGLVVAGLGTLSAVIGGAIPHQDAKEPIYFEGLFAYFKLSLVALCSYIGSRAFGKYSRD